VPVFFTNQLGYTAELADSIEQARRLMGTPQPPPTNQAASPP